LPISEIVVGSRTWSAPASVSTAAGRPRQRDGMNSGTTSATPAAASTPFMSMASKPAPNVSPRSGM
jgi:hypothetical protein